MEKKINFHKYVWLLIVIVLLCLSTLMILIANYFSDNVSSILISFGTGIIASSIVSIMIEIRSFLEKKKSLDEFKYLFNWYQKNNVVMMYLDCLKSVNKILSLLNEECIDNLYYTENKVKVLEAFEHIQKLIDGNTLDNKLLNELYLFYQENYEEYLDIYDMFMQFLNSDIFGIEEKKNIIEMNTPVRKIRTLRYQLDQDGNFRNANKIFDIYKATFTLCFYYIDNLRISKVLTDAMLEQNYKEDNRK